MAEDLVQETFVQAWRSIDSLRDPERGRAWLFQILRYRFSHELRRRGRRLKAADDLEQVNRAEDEAGPDVLSRLCDQELLQASLDGMAPRFKEPLLLVFLNGFTCRETAELLEIPLGTVLSRIHRGRQQLRATLRRLGGAGGRDAPDAVKYERAEP